MEPKNDAELSHGVHSVLLSLRVRGYAPTDVEYGSPRLKAYNEKNNDATREDALDQLEEARDVARQRISKVSNATTTNMSVDGTSISVTWCYGEARTTRDGTSLHRRGKGHTSSQKY
jgi:hypothetical protein